MTKRGIWRDEFDKYGRRNMNWLTDAGRKELICFFTTLFEESEKKAYQDGYAKALEHRQMSKDLENSNK